MHNADIDFLPALKGEVCRATDQSSCVLSPGLAPGRLSGLSPAPAANLQRLLAAGADPGIERFLGGTSLLIRLCHLCESATSHCASACAFTNTEAGRK